MKLLADSVVHDAVHANRLLAQQRVASLNAAAESAELGPWFLLDAATPEMPVFNQAAVAGPPAAAADLETAERWYGERGSRQPFSSHPAR